MDEGNLRVIGQNCEITRLAVTGDTGDFCLRVINFAWLLNSHKRTRVFGLDSAFLEPFVEWAKEEDLTVQSPATGEILHVGSHGEMVTADEGTFRHLDALREEGTYPEGRPVSWRDDRLGELSGSVRLFVKSFSDPQIEITEHQLTTLLAWVRYYINAPAFLTPTSVEIVRDLRETAEAAKTESDLKEWVLAAASYGFAPF